ncbi:hypothetical protein AVEN_71253-1 [Araneus ventricosus]|uniref:Uncharacterized protein n=1 Tax=Araneus ventricosus TaxID=182803 RepID=A0A4Y2NUH2_ARAVE|nr:hypothetical protein AVEN_246761-1 [Araneus ventricosus]GBN42364.1 hypothetical protein AVEN_71253-1 [Araneus ventricosus]
MGRFLSRCCHGKNGSGRMPMGNMRGDIFIARSGRFLLFPMEVSLLRIFSQSLDTAELPPSCLGILGQLKNGRHDSSGTEAGDLLPITGHGPTPSEGGTFRHRSGGNSTTHHSNAHQGSENLPTYPVASHPRTRGAPERE